MSRRKQPRPRHLDTEDELAAILINGSGSRPPHGEPGESRGEMEDAHVCGKCQEEFLVLSDFLLHKKSCSNKRIVILYDEDEKKSPSEHIDSHETEHTDFEDEVDESFFKEEDPDTAEDKAVDQDKSHELQSSDRSELSDDKHIGMGDANNNDDSVHHADPMDVDDKDPPESPSDSDTTTQLPQLPGSATSLLPDSNVKLETMDSTKVAVAQFAENNLPPSDFALLQQTLFSLQQQQVLQLQLLQQLQHQLMSGMAPTLDKPQLLPPSLPIGTNAITTTTNTILSPTKTSSSEADLRVSISITSSMSSSVQQTTTTSQTSIGATPFDILRQEACVNGSGLVPAPRPSYNNPTTTASEAFHKGKPPNVTVSGLDRSQYAADDPFFKHKCRFCHKVFGSDSALQIHIRSHTGERPFKCNVCGNRFSTRGNLKVHFSRHKAKYPHVRMNPHPVPEHLDRLQSSAPRSSTLGTPLHRPPPTGPRPLPPSRPQPKDMDTTAPAAGKATENGSSPPATALSSQPSPVSTASNSSTPHNTPTPVSKALAPTPPNDMKALVPVSSNMMNRSLPQIPLPSSLGSPVPPGMNPFDMAGSPFFRSSILPAKVEDPLEQYMEVNKSETSKLQQLVENIEQKLSDPNQCAICHRVLSCKSALQMHYRIHTGERPFKCKICGRAFTTKGNLKTHMGVHRAKPPMRMMHQCPVCHKQFTNSLVLQQHIRMHTADIPHNNYKMGGDMLPPMFLHAQEPFPRMPFSAPGIPLPGHTMPNHGGELDLRKLPSNRDEKSTPGSSEDGLKMDTSSAPGESDQGNESEPARPPTAASELSSEQNENMSPTSETGERDPDKAEKGSEAGEQDMEEGENDEHSGEQENKNVNSTDPSTLKAMPNQPPSSRDFPMMFSHPSVITSSYMPHYSTSLMALEERVRAIDSMVPHPHLLQPMQHLAAMMPHPHAPMHHPHPMPHPMELPMIHHSRTPPGSHSGEDMSPASYPRSQASPRISEGSSPTATQVSPSLPYSGQDVSTRPSSGTSPGSKGLPNGEHSTGASPVNDKLDAASDGHHSPGFSTKDSERTSPQSTGHGLQSSSAPSPYANSDSNASADSGIRSEEYQSMMSGMFGYKGLSPLDIPASMFDHKSRLNTTCNVCFKTFACKSALDIHYRSHTKERPFKCEACDRCFSTRGNMKQHMLTHKIRDLPSGQAFTNSDSSQSGDNASVKAEQLTPKKGDSPIPGKEACTPETPPVSSMNVKPEQVTPPNRETKPETLGTPPSGMKPDNMLTPMSSMKPDNIVTPTSSHKADMSGIGSKDHHQSPFLKRSSPKHGCQICHKPFSSASALQIHIRTHTGDRPFKCTVCGKAFTTKGNLKVHMGTHMWNNTPSRRGRRMSIDMAPMANPKEAEYFSSFAHRSPQDMYRFPFGGFTPNGFPPKMNEISVIQSLNGNMNHMPPMDPSMVPMPPAVAEAMMKAQAQMQGSPMSEPLKAVPNSQSEPLMKSDTMMKNEKSVGENKNNNELHSSGNSGELDLSMKKPSTPPTPGLEKRSESPHNASWVWKTTCHLCNKVCSSASSLEQHMKTHMPGPQTSPNSMMGSHMPRPESSPKPLMT